MPSRCVYFDPGDGRATINPRGMDEAMRDLAMMPDAGSWGGAARSSAFLSGQCAALAAVSGDPLSRRRRCCARDELPGYMTTRPSQHQDWVTSNCP